MAAAFVPVALFGPKTALGQFGVISPVLSLVSVITMWSEALLFIKSPAIQEHWVRNVISDTVSHLIAAIALVILWRILKLTHPSTRASIRSPLAKAAAMVALCGIAYLVYYLVFGGLTYQLFTKRYYPDAGAAVADWVTGSGESRFARGLIMTLAIVPAIYTLRLAGGRPAICAGLLLWVAGGLSLLMVPNELMTSTQRFIHIIEIFTQPSRWVSQQDCYSGPNGSLQPSSHSSPYSLPHHPECFGASQSAIPATSVATRSIKTRPTQLSAGLATREAHHQ